MFPVILGRPGIVESTCPATGQAIRLEVTPDGAERLDPPDVVVSAVRPTGALADVRASTCQLGHFFSSRAAATQWADEHPDGYIIPVEEAFRLDRAVIKQLGWDAARAQHDERSMAR
jgi:alkylmercury lyase